jgi:hypothetical protein
MRLQKSTLALLSLYGTAQAWAPPQRRIHPTRRPQSTTTIRLAQSSDANTQEPASFSREDMVNGDASSGSRIIPAAMSGKSQLAAAFTALDESDQYDAVLTGLCAKILDSKEDAPQTATLEDTAALLTEMNQRRIPASPRSLMALIDVSY